MSTTVRTRSRTSSGAGSCITCGAFLELRRNKKPPRSFLAPRCSSFSFLITALTHCSALLCFRVRHEIPSLGTWGGGEEEGRRGERQLHSSWREGGGGASRPTEHAYLLSPRNNSSGTDEYHGGGGDDNEQQLQCDTYCVDGKDWQGGREGGKEGIQP